MIAYPDCPFFDVIVHTIRLPKLIIPRCEMRQGDSGSCGCILFTKSCTECDIGLTFAYAKLTKQFQHTFMGAYPVKKYV